MTSPQHVLDCDALPASKLRSKYKPEANSHRAMLDRRKSGAIVADDLLEFRNFLRVLGPRPAPGYTVDRLNSNDPEYALPKIQWRTKKDQSRNRRNVIVLTDMDGTSRPLSEWAELTGQSRFTLHSRRKRGFSDAEVIRGPSQETSWGGQTQATRRFSWPGSKQEHWLAWEKQYLAHARTGPDFVHREPRAAYLLRVLRDRHQTLAIEVERDVNPEIEPGPEHDELFRRWDVCARELRRAAAMFRNSGRRTDDDGI